MGKISLGNFVKSAKSLIKRLKGSFSFGKPSRYVNGATFYFGLGALALFGLLWLNADSLAQPDTYRGPDILLFNSFFKNDAMAQTSDPFFNQNKEFNLETPDLEIVQDNSVRAVSTPSILNVQTLGDVFGSSQDQRTDVIDYTVVAGDTVKSLAEKFFPETDLIAAEDTIAWANGISKNTILQEGRDLTILPVPGIIHIAKSGDTIDQIAKTYKAKAEDILAYNNNDSNLYIGQPVVVPGGVLPQKNTVHSIYSDYASLPSSFFIFPLLKFTITQGLHYFNAVDLAGPAGAPVYAAASGAVERAAFDRRYGNYIVLAHENGARTYYGHLASMRVKAGDNVTIGEQIGTEGRTGTEATGNHLHFGVYGGFRNPAAGFPVGSEFVDGALVK